MAALRTMRDAARYGAGHLEAINTDIQTEQSYSRKMRNDMDLAIRLLKEAPDAYYLLAVFSHCLENGRKPTLRLLKKARQVLMKVHEGGGS